MRLRLRKNQSSFPNEVFQEKNLKILEVVGDGLTEIPAQIGALSALENLSIQAQQVTQLPKEVFELPRLKILKVKSCPLSGLPASGQGQSLERVQLVHTGLKQLPAWFCELANLQELDLTNNDLDTLPSDFLRLTKLRRLILDNNQFSLLPDSLYQMPNLRHLSVDGNHFSEQEKDKISGALGIWF